MSECDDQLRHVCGWNRRLSRENTLLWLKIRSLEQRLAVLEKQAADLAVERSALNTVLGAAMDAALEGSNP
ncbi:MAG: hypothetical protein WB998_12820 [Solirubrobacteraceae bacterium]